MNTTVSLYEIYEGDFAKGVSREEILSWSEKIPPLPKHILAILKMLDSPMVDAEDLASLIELNPPLAASLLRLAHSPIYALGLHSMTVKQAIDVVGFTQVRILALAATLQGFSEQEPIDDLIWEHAIATAISARTLAQYLPSANKDELFLLGLLLPLGQFILLACPQTRLAYPEVLQIIKDKGLDYPTAELEVIGYPHHLIGALTAKRWNLSDDLAHIILSHEDPVECLDSAFEQKRAIIKLANLIAHGAFIGRPPGYPIAMEEIQELCRTIGVDLNRARGVVDLIVEVRNLFQMESCLWRPS